MLTVNNLNNELGVLVMFKLAIKVDR